MPVSSITDRRLHIQPAEVHSVLGRHMLADGYEIVMDLRKSKGSWVFDSKRGRAVLDFFTNFASCPIGYNHPRLDTPEFREKLADVAMNKPANSDIYTTYFAEFVETFYRLAIPASHNRHLFFIEGGALGVENAVKAAMDWKVRKRFLAERKDDIAAFIMEPIQGEGGDNHFRPEFLKAMRQLCDENDMLLIFDEVQTGVGLTGRMWGFQNFGVEPDFFCYGKKTQVCGFASNDRIFDIDDNVFIIKSRINSTWGGNLTDMVRSQRFFEIIEEEKMVENAAKVGAYFLSELQQFGEKFPKLVSNVRGRGLMAAFDLPSGELRDK